MGPNMNVNIENMKNYLKLSNLFLSYIKHSEEHWFIKDLESRYVYMNDSALRYFNVPKSFDIEGKFDHEVPLQSSQELWPELVKHDQRVMEENQKISAIEIHRYGKGNTDTLVPHLCSKAPIYDDSNNCIGVICHGMALDAPSFLHYMNRTNKTTVELGAPKHIFTPREFEIAFWLQQRLTSKEIARKLELSHRTVENRIHIMYHKAEVNTFRQFIEYCQACNLDKYVPASFIQKGVQMIL